jgi:hypothetical protein
VYYGIDADMAAWIERQPVFFVATAPLATDGLDNLSPKGAIGTFRVAGSSTFAYLDVTGSRVGTIARPPAGNGRVSTIRHSYRRISRVHAEEEAALSVVVEQ